MIAYYLFNEGFRRFYQTMAHKPPCGTPAKPTATRPAHDAHAPHPAKAYTLPDATAVGLAATGTAASAPPP
ncbi:hypothetical protein HLV38_03105 [Berryella wangjianweii]|uniref:Uncharacterized protein n=1 Tax=Berryella wangjianweii TaxID=2734634 RepID=A0A6M8IWV8_9ACTN|nr:hypothetical protein [Berryella wangjianweii]QKF07225.1 hypothetical protein HLV38_03105 [Berryella wangjianweii]